MSDYFQQTIKWVFLQQKLLSVLDANSGGVICADFEIPQIIDLSLVLITVLKSFLLILPFLQIEMEIIDS